MIAHILAIVFLEILYNPSRALDARREAKFLWSRTFDTATEKFGFVTTQMGMRGGLDYGIIKPLICKTPSLLSSRLQC